MLKSVKDLFAKKGWWKGQVVIPYNLMWLLIIFGILLLPVIIAGAVVVAVAFLLWWLAGVVIKAACKLWPFILAFCTWLWSLLLKFWAWIKSLFQGKPRNDKPTGKKNNWWWWLLLILILLLLGLFKWCGNHDNVEPNPEAVTPVESVQEELIVYQSSWNDALYARVYLDGLRNDATLAGYKYRDGKPAKNAEFNGNAASEAWNVMFEEWLPVLQDNITADLNDNQRVATWLYALRSGKYGFAKSDFVKAVNAGDMDKAGEYLFKIHKANGTVRSAGDELKSYLYVIRLIWDGKISVEKLKDCHCFSYKAYPVSKGYRPDDLVKVIKTRNPLDASTPRELLD
jgi:hypothetical protein